MIYSLVKPKPCQKKNSLRGEGKTQPVRKKPLGVTNREVIVEERKKEKVKKRPTYIPFILFLERLNIPFNRLASVRSSKKNYPKQDIL